MLKVWFEGDGDLQVPHDRLPRPGETVEITLGAGTSHPVRRPVKIGTHIRTLRDKNQGRARLTEESKRLLGNHGTLDEVGGKWFFEPTVTRLTDAEYEEMLKVWFEGEGDLQVPHDRLPRTEETVEITVGAGTSHPVRRSVNIGIHIRTLRDRRTGRARLTEDSKRLLRNHGTLNEARGKWFFEPTSTRLTDQQFEEALKVWFEGEGDLQVPHDRLPREKETVEITVGAGTSHPVRRPVNIGIHIKNLRDKSHGRVHLTEESQRLLRNHGTLDEADGKWFLEPLGARPLRLTDADYEEMLKVWFEGEGDLQVPHDRLPRTEETVEITVGAGT
ncbi:hypothetical protein, partial [Streptomyces sp. NPDC018034]|uniref:hypothetical protein n=1 Tax=unclassified Streptomyces TaxID=2593676 RepID=UPI00379B1D05